MIDRNDDEKKPALLPGSSLPQYALAAVDGCIGWVRDLFFCDDDWTIPCLVARVGSWLHDRRVLVQRAFLGSVSNVDKTISVSLTRSQVRHATPAEFNNSKANIRIARDTVGLLHKAPALVSVQSAFPSHGMSEPASSFPQNGYYHLLSCDDLLTDYTFHARDGEIGGLHEILINPDLWRIEYFVVQKGVLFSRKLCMIQPNEAGTISPGNREVFVDIDLSALDEAPDYKYFKQYLVYGGRKD